MWPAEFMFAAYVNFQKKIYGLLSEQSTAF